MNALKLLLFLFFLPNIIGAQVKMPVIGASYYYQIDKSPDKKALPAKGNVKFWDYGLLASPYIINYKTSSPSKESFIPKGSSLVFKSSNDQSYFYNITKTNLGLTGYAGSDFFEIGYRSNIEYTNSFKENLSGLKIGKLLTEVSETYIEFGIDNLKDAFLKKLPVLPDSIRLNVLITRKNRVDGVGKLFLPDITLSPCTRITREESYDYTIDTKTGNYKWVDASTLFADNINDLPSSKVDILFYSPKYIFPVLKLSTDASHETVLRAEYMVPDKTALLKDKPAGLPDITLFPNPAYTKNIKVEFSNIPAGRYTFKMYSLIGKLEKSTPYYINNSKFDIVDISDLKPGIYIYALVDGTGKIIQSKRLTIISP